MTIASEITRLQGAKADIKTAIENKGVTVSSADTIDQYAGYIDQIETGGGVEGLEIETIAVSDVAAGEFSDVSVGDISYTTTALPNAASSVYGSVCVAIDDERVLCVYTGAVSVVDVNTGAVLSSTSHTLFTATQVSKLADGVFLMSGNTSYPSNYLRILLVDEQNNISFGSALSLGGAFVSYAVMEDGKVLVASSKQSTSSPNLFLYVASIAGTVITLGTERSVSTTGFYNELPAVAMTGNNTFAVFGKQAYTSYGTLVAYFGQVSGDTVGTVSSSTFSEKVPNVSLRPEVIRSGNSYYVAARLIEIRDSSGFPYSSGAVIKITFNGSSITAVQVMMDSFNTSTNSYYCVGFCGSAFGLISAACLAVSGNGIYFGGRFLSTVGRMNGGANSGVMTPCVVGKNAFVCSGSLTGMVLLKVALPILVDSVTGLAAVGVPSENIGVGQTGLVKVPSVLNGGSEVSS